MDPPDIPRSVARAPATAEPAAAHGDALARWLLTRSPLGRMVRRVARVHASVHTKLLAAFLLIAFLLVAMTLVSLETITSVSRQSRLLDKARERVDASRRIEQAVGVQMSVLRNAVTLRDETTLTSMLEDQNRFTDALRRLEGRSALGRARHHAAP